MRISYGPEAFFQKYGGVSKYFIKISEGLARKGHDVDIVAPSFVTENLKHLSHARLQGSPVVADSKWSRSVLRTASIIRGRSKIAKLKPDIFHPTYYSLLDTLPSRTKTVVTVYDFVHEKMGGRSYVETNLTRIRKHATIHRAHLIIAISNSTKNDLLNFFPRIDPSTVFVTPLGVDLVAPSVPQNQNGEGKRTILWVGPRGRYKNFEVVVSALKLLPKSRLEGVNLVLFGGEALSNADIQELVHAGLKRTQFSHIVGDDARKTGLYRIARMLLYTSKYEGFGLPILEAMAAGCPVICSSVSSMPEVAGDAALQVDPSDPEDVAAAIEQLLGSDETHERLRQSGFSRAALFSWDACVDKTESAYLTVLE